MAVQRHSRDQLDVACFLLFFMFGLFDPFSLFALFAPLCLFYWSLPGSRVHTSFLSWDIILLVSKFYLVHKTSWTNLLVVTKENLDGQPSVTTDLEAVLQVVELVDLLICQGPAVDIEVALNAGLVHRLGDNTPALGNTPNEEDLLRSLALLLSDLQESGVPVERRVGGAETRVTSGVDALGGVVGNQLGGGVVGVQFDLVDGGDDLGGGVIEKLLQILDTEVGDTDVADLAGGRQLLHLLPGLDEVPVGQVLRLVLRVGGAGPVDQVEVHVVGAEVLKGGVNALGHTVVPGVVQLGGEPDLVAGHA